MSTKNRPLTSTESGNKIIHDLKRNSKDASQTKPGKVLTKTSVSPDWSFISYVLVITISLIFWFTGSPDPRYGGVFMSLLPLTAAGVILSTFKKETYLKIARPTLITVFTAISVIVLILLASESFRGGRPPLKRSEDYLNLTCYEATLDGTTIYIPSYSDQGGYNYFPETTGETILNVIELRGTTPEDGFRIRPEYQNLPLNTYGEVMQ